jgi:hypothetical protein
MIDPFDPEAVQNEQRKTQLHDQALTEIDAWLSDQASIKPFEAIAACLALLTEEEYVLRRKRCATRLDLEISMLNRFVSKRRPKKKDEIPEVIRAMNDRFFVVGSMGGKCRIIAHEADPAIPDRLRMDVQTFGDFRNRFDHIGAVGSQWIDHQARRQYDSIAFAPGQNLGPRVYNLWKGFAVEPKKGDCSLYLAHVKDNICSGDNFLSEWVVNWMSYAVQHPDEPGHTAIVLQGNKGTGKNTFADKFGKLWGTHYFAINNPVHLAGRFNSHLRECSVLFGNEAFYAGNHEHENVLKGLITDEWLPIEAKFQDLITVRNVLHVILASNSDWIVRTSMDERRFCVLNVSDEHREDKRYFQAINQQMNSGGHEALLYSLLHRDLKQFDPRSAPRTSAMAEQTAQSLHGAEAAWYECLTTGEIPATVDKSGTTFLRSSDLVEWSQEHNRNWRGFSAKEVGNLFGENPRLKNKQPMGFEQRRPLLFFGDGNAMEQCKAWVIPTLAECRKRWMIARDAHSETWNTKGDENWRLIQTRRMRGESYDEIRASTS